MALRIQVVVLDQKDYILEFKDFKPTEQVNILEYIWKHTNNPSATKIHMRKCKD